VARTGGPDQPGRTQGCRGGSEIRRGWRTWITSEWISAASHTHGRTAPATSCHTAPPAASPSAALGAVWLATITSAMQTQ
jgi:hypothetical protein